MFGKIFIMIYICLIRIDDYGHNHGFIPLDYGYEIETRETPSPLPRSFSYKV